MRGARPCRFAAAITAVALLASTAGAQPSCPAETGESYQGPMRFSVRERPGQRPVLIAEGFIDPGVVPRLTAALAEFSGTEIWIRSDGGHVGPDRDAGRLIRERGLVTRIPSGWTCRGACNFMFLGGMVRIVEPGGHFAVQMFAHSGGLDNWVEIARSSRMIATEDYDYLLRVGASTRLLSEVMYREPAEPGTPGRCMTLEELYAFGVTTLPPGTTLRH